MHDTREDPDYHLYATPLFKGILYDLSLLTIWKFGKERNFSNWKNDKKNKSTNLNMNIIFLIIREILILLLIYLFLADKNIINIIKVGFLYHYSLFAISIALFSSSLIKGTKVSANRDRFHFVIPGWLK